MAHPKPNLQPRKLEQELQLQPGRIVSAKLTGIKEYGPATDYLVEKLFFDCPLDYSENAASGETLQVCFKLVYGIASQNAERLTITTGNLQALLRKKKILVFLCGGPGVDSPPDRMPVFNQHFLDKGYWILFPDYRGTGDSSSHLVSAENATQTAEYCRFFRQTDIARDLESVRRCLLGPGRKWTLFGQSFGTWVALSYLSFDFAAESVEGVFLTGGLPPATASGPEEVYENLFPIVVNVTDRFYEQYPGDDDKVLKIASFLAEREDEEGAAAVPLLTSAHGVEAGRLTVQRFLCSGRLLGSSQRFPDFHDLIEKMHRDIVREGRLTQAALRQFQGLDRWNLNRRPLFALVHEAMYCNKRGSASDWAAAKVAGRTAEYWWVNHQEGRPKALREGIERAKKEQKRLYFSGEMVYPSTYATWSELQGGLARAGEAIAAHPWGEDLYNFRQMRENVKKIPIAAVVYENDMYVTPRLSRDLARALDLVEGTHFVVEPDLEHGAIRTHTARLLDSLEELAAKQ
ncbi:Alpha/Beta hydrolase protein [Xylariaceae sp. FL0804]|nr:Alpha/Beta hydrolase protein [Xylariaceae sp. FL0804]